MKLFFLNDLIKKKSKEKSFFYWLIIWLFIFVVSIKFFFFNYIIGDGNTFFTVGNRILQGNIDAIYQNIVGSAPFVYLPHSSLLFAPISIFAFNTPYIQFNPYSGLSFISVIFIVFKISKMYDKSPSFFLFNILLIFLFFGHIIYESLYIGQIDLILCLAIFLVCIRADYFSKIFFALTCIIKPQLVIFIISYFKQNRSILIILIMIFSNVILFTIYSVLVEDPLVKIKNQISNLFVLGLNDTRAVVCQNFLDVANRLLNANDIGVGGRYWPEMFNGRKYYFLKTQILNPKLIKIIWITLSLIILFTLIKFYKKSDKLLYFGLMSSTLPTIFPLFWHVHFVYLIPAFLIISSRFVINKNYYSFFTLISLSFLMLLSNYYIFDPRIADVMLFFGSNYFYSIALFILYFFEIKKSLIKKTKYSSSTIK